MPGIDEIEQISANEKIEGGKKSIFSPEDIKKANKAFNNPNILNNPDFRTFTNKIQTDADINTQNTINNITHTFGYTRENIQDRLNKYGLQIHVNYGGNGYMRNTANKKMEREEIKSVKSFIFEKGKLKIDQETYTKINHLVETDLTSNLNSIKNLLQQEHSDEELSRLLNEKKQIIENILNLTGISDPLFKEYLDSYDNNSLTSNNNVYSFLNQYTTYQTIEGKTETSKDLINILKSSDNPFLEIKNHFSKSSEDQKIEVARFFSKLLSENYKDDGTNPTDKDMTNAIKSYIMTGEKMSAGVCRHMHSATAQLLQDLGLEAGLISTNSGGPHAITLGKKADGSYFFIDYGTIYTAKNLKDMQAQYMAQHGSIGLQETISTPDGKVIGFFKTFLEEQVSKNASALGTDNTTAYSETIAKQGSLNTVTGEVVDANITTDKNADISYQKGGKHSQIKIDASKINSTEGNLSSVGVSGKIFFGKNNTTAIGGKIAKQNIDYTSIMPENTNNFSGTTINITGEKVKQLYISENAQVNVGLATQATILTSNRNNTTKGFDKIQDASNNSALTVAGTQNIGKNFNIQANVGINAISDFTNERSENMVKPYVGMQAGGGLKYSFNKGGNIGVNGEYTTNVGERTFLGGLQATDKSGKTNVTLNYLQTTPTIPFGEKEIKINLGLSRNITENAMLYITGSYEKNKSQIIAGGKRTF